MARETAIRSGKPAVDRGEAGGGRCRAAGARPAPDALDTVQPGAVIGPLPVADGWALHVFEEEAPASLEDGAMRQALRDELFERWIGEQLERLTVEITVPPDA